MNKDSQKDTLTQSVTVLPELIADRSYYQMLISNKHKSFRKEMIEKLDALMTPTIGFDAWKNRFLYPSTKIPKRNRQEIAEAMEEFLARELQIQGEYIDAQIHLRSRTIENLKNEAKAFEYIKERTKTAIEIYKNGKQN